MELPTFNVLMIEDSASDARLINEMLCHARNVKFTVERTERLATGIKRLEQNDIDVVLLDLALPDSHGIDTFLDLRKAAPEIPVIILSGFRSQEMAIKAVHEGAQDYLFKEYSDADALERSIRYAIERQRSQEALQGQTRILQSILNSMSDGVIVVDEEGNCLMSNPAAERLTGLKPSDLPLDEVHAPEGWYLPDRVTPHPPDQLPLVLARRGQEVHGQEVFLRHAQRPEGILVSVNATPLRDSIGRIGGGVAVFRDVSTRAN